MRKPSEYSLFGDCFRFVADYANTETFKDCTIEILVTPKLGSLIHAYFMGKDGAFIDSRMNPFRTRSELLSVFEIGEKRAYVEGLCILCELTEEEKQFVFKNVK